MSLARTSEQRAWLGRLSALSFSFTRSTAFALAGVEPKITITPADWLYLTSRMLDRSWVDHYTVPQLLRSVARLDTDTPATNTLLLIAGRDVFKASSASRKIDFWDFNNAIVELIVAGAVEEAAERFIHCFPALMRMTSFEPMEILFMILNGEPIHEKIANPITRWILLQTELAIRQQDTKAAQSPKIMKLFKRMRELLRANLTLPSKNHFRATFHAMVCVSVFVTFQ